MRHDGEDRWIVSSRNGLIFKLVMLIPRKFRTGHYAIATPNHKCSSVGVLWRSGDWYFGTPGSIIDLLTKNIFLTSRILYIHFQTHNTFIPACISPLPSWPISPQPSSSLLPPPLIHFAAVHSPYLKSRALNIDTSSNTATYSHVIHFIAQSLDPTSWT